MSILGNVVDLNKTLTGLLASGSGSLSSPMTNLVTNLTGSGGSGLIDPNLLGSTGTVLMNVGGKALAILPNNGGIVTADLLGPGGLGGLPGDLTQIIELDGLLSDARLLNLTGLLDNGVLSLGGVLGETLKLLSPGGALDPNDLIDPDGEIDPDAFAHQLLGTSGRDIFTIPLQSTYVDGRGDIDIANFARNAEGMSFAVGRNGVVFADEDKVFFMRDVERVSFFEGTLLLDTGAGENAGMAYRIYQAALDRTPDAGGLEYWLGALDSGAASFTAIANHFIHSREFITTFGTAETVSNARFIELMYTHTLGRSFDRAGLEFWVQKLEGSAFSRADVLAHFAESGENQQRVAAQIDNGIWLA